MKIIKLFSGLEFLVEDDEAENIASKYKSKTLLKLRSGDYIASSGIEAITDPEMVAFAFGAMLYKDCRTYENEYGNKVKLKAEDYDQIEYKIHPKYKALIISNKSKKENKKLCSNNKQ